MTNRDHSFKPYSSTFQKSNAGNSIFPERFYCMETTPLKVAGWVVFSCSCFVVGASVLNTFRVEFFRQFARRLKWQMAVFFTSFKQQHSILEWTTHEIASSGTRPYGCVTIWSFGCRTRLPQYPPVCELCGQFLRFDQPNGCTRQKNCSRDSGHKLAAVCYEEHSSRCGFNSTLAMPCVC